MSDDNDDLIQFRSSRSGKFRPGGLWGKVKFDVLPPQGDADVTIVGPAAVLATGLIAGYVVGGRPGLLSGGLVAIAAVAVWRRK